MMYSSHRLNAFGESYNLLLFKLFNRWAVKTLTGLWFQSGPLQHWSPKYWVMLSGFQEYYRILKRWFVFTFSCCYFRISVWQIASIIIMIWLIDFPDFYFKLRSIRILRLNFMFRYSLLSFILSNWIIWAKWNVSYLNFGWKPLKYRISNLSLSRARISSISNWTML